MATSTTTAGTTTASKSWRDTFPIHPACELFPPISTDELRTLGEDIKKRGLQNRIALWAADPNNKKFLLDGRNRLDAMELVGLDPHSCSRVTLYGNQGVDPHAYVVSANLHRRHLTAEQKRDLIGKLLKATPEKSDRQIAETVKASPTTVGTVRTKMEAKGDVSKLDTRRDSKGRKQPAKKQTVQAMGKKPTASVKQPDKPKPEVPARDDTGSNSADEIKRLNARIDELQNEKRRIVAESLDLRSAIRQGGHLQHEAPVDHEVERGEWRDKKGKLHKGIRVFTYLRNVIASFEDDPNEAERIGHAIVRLAKEWRLALTDDDDGLEIPECLRRTAP
jgi:hypothetical protein